MRVLRLVWIAWLGLGAAAIQARAQEARVTELRILPPQVRLDDARDRQRIVVLATDVDGVHRDVTALATVALENPVALENGGDPIAELRDGELRPLAAGKATLVAQWRGARAAAAVEVVGVERPEQVSFANDVLPVLTRAGCNAGSCHGAASGKNGFRLSLFGYDPALDHRSLTRELRGRRADPSTPEQSLLLTKPTGAVAHKGGVRFDEDTPAYALLRDWIASGVPQDVDTAATVTALEVLPRTVVLPVDGEPARLVVRATYSDGSDRDVTELSLLSSSNEVSVALLPGGQIAPHRSGEAAIMARFGPMAQVAQVLVVPADRELVWPEAAVARGPIDEFVHRKLRRMRVAPAEVCSDEVFVRRVYVDVLNRLPRKAEVLAFFADEAADKRERLVETLVADPGFADVWAMTWAEALQIRRSVHGDKGVTLFRRFLREGFAEGRSFAAMVRELLTASGDTHTNPAANFYVGASAPNLVGERVAQAFLGIRVQCAQCHDHPFDNWTMDDYYGFAAYFAQVGRKVGEDGYQSTIWNRRYGDVRHARTRELAVPTVLGGTPQKIPYGTDRRAVLADWVASADNPWFARSVVNRVWARMFGRGIVDPPDDVRVSNPPSHPDLLDELARRFVASGFDTRQLVRDICASRTYQLGPHPEAVDAALFAGNAVRRLSAEALLDGIAEVTGVPNDLTGLPVGASATALEGDVADSRFLSVFGRPDRQSACTCERAGEPTLGQALHLLNGDTISDKLAQSKGRIATRLREKVPPERILDEVFLTAYARYPSDDERARLLGVLAAAGDAPLEAWQDLAWALLNSKEFVFQH